MQRVHLSPGPKRYAELRVAALFGLADGTLFQVTVPGIFLSHAVVSMRCILA